MAKKMVKTCEGKGHDAAMLEEMEDECKSDPDQGWWEGWVMHGSITGILLNVDPLPAP